jgi:ankyrin repeat protein
MAATRNGHAEVVRLLLANKADTQRTLDTGETALDLATRYNNTEIFDLLRKAGAKSGRTATIEVR